MDLYPTSPDLLYVHCVDPCNSELHNLEIFSFRIQSMAPVFLYQLSRQSLWRAREADWAARDVIEWIRTHTADSVPVDMQKFILETMSGDRELQLISRGGNTTLTGDSSIIEEVKALPSLESLLVADDDHDRLRIRDHATWSLKTELFRLGYSVTDQRMSNRVADSVVFSLRERVRLRNYQQAAVDSFLTTGDSGVMVLPCGAGKTVVGVAVAAALQKRTFILVPGEAAAHQWYTHLKIWTTLKDSDISIDDGKSPLAPVTIATYQRLSARNRDGAYHHLDRYTKLRFGLVIYDEVHLLPAPLFRLAASLHTDRALGLSATLIREDGRAADVYALIGRKLFEVYPDDLIRQGYLANVACIEVKVPLPASESRLYQSASARDRHRIAADNSNKMDVVKHLCERHSNGQILIMGHYTTFLKEVSRKLNFPMLDGKAVNRQRLDTYELFRKGHIQRLVLSRIANMAVDLPNADVAIQVSGLFGSRQEEAQRLGRLLRPKRLLTGTFYSLVSEGTVEEKTARHRQRYLVENGFAYNWKTVDELIRERAD